MAEVDSKDNQTPLLEWIFGAIGLVLFTGALVVTTINGISPDRPPAIEVRTQLPVVAGGRFLVEVEALNLGDETAALVQLAAMLKDGETVVESHTLEIDFLPPHSSKHAGVFFRRNPEGLTVTVEAASYQRP